MKQIETDFWWIYEIKWIIILISSKSFNNKPRFGSHCSFTLPKKTLANFTSLYPLSVCIKIDVENFDLVEGVFNYYLFLCICAFADMSCWTFVFQLLSLVKQISTFVVLDITRYPLFGLCHGIVPYTQVFQYTRWLLYLLNLESILNTKTICNFP